MSLKLFAASVVLVVGIALASLFPKDEQDLTDQPVPGGVALRRSAPLSEGTPVSSAARGLPLPPVETAAMTPAETGGPHARYVANSAERTQFRSPPRMPSEYRTAATKHSPQPTSTSHGSQSPQDHTVRPSELVHRVVDGDTLPALAARYLGDADLADRIRQTNRERLPENPNWLPIGVEIQIPPHTRDLATELANVARPTGAETRLVPIAPAPVVADTQSR